MSTTLSPIKSGSANRRKLEIRQDGWCIFAILAILFVRFFQTIVLAKPISKLFLVSVWDSLFYPHRVGQSLPVDYALPLLLLPYRFFVADYWHHAIPLWNQFNGFGMPLLADPQALVFSPIFFFFYLFPSLYSWDITLIAELAIGAVSTYLLCRELDLDFVAGLVAALLFAFCPWVQWQLEPLGSGICLTPFVLLFFARTAKRKSLWNAVLAGFAAAIDVLSSHPEVCFVTIIFACLLMCFVAYYQDKSRFNWIFVLSRIALAGTIAVGISAPALFPFLEYLHNGETYKFNRPAPTDISWQALIANYLYPFFSVSSPFLGPLSWAGLLSAACFSQKSGRFTVPLFACLFISVFAIAKLFPINLILLVPPLSAVQPMYCFPEYLAFLAIVSGTGISHLVGGIGNVTRTRMVVALIVLVALLTVPLIYVPWHHNSPYLRFDQILQVYHFHTRIWLLNVASLAVMLLVWRMTANCAFRLKTIGCISFITLGVLNLAVVSYFSLPARPSFEYPTALPINIAAPNGSRFISFGDHLFRPNTNLIYKLPTVRVHNPLFPKGYLAFMKACGAEFDDFNQYFPATVSRLLDITGTRTILSEQPLLDEEATIHLSKPSAANQTTPRINYGDLITLNDLRLFIDRKHGAIFCCLLATPNSFKTGSYQLDCKVEDADGVGKCFIEPKAISGTAGRQSITFSTFLPASLKHWTLSLKLTRDNDSILISPSATGTNFGSIRNDGSVVLATSEQPELFTVIENERFKPVERYGSSIVAYENKTALNPYFFVKRVEWVKEGADALTYLKKHSNELGDVVALEEFQRNQFDQVVAKICSPKDNVAIPMFDQLGTIKRVNSGNTAGIVTSPTLELQAECLKTSLLVISDLYYPGWKVFLDGQEWPMFRADSLFRAVPIPVGKHHLRFEYHPMSFSIGLLSFMVTSLILSVCFWLRRGIGAPIFNRFYNK